VSQISFSKSSNSTAKKAARKSALDDIRALARPDDWAVDMELRVDGRPFSLVGREYVRDVIRDYSAEIWIPKAAQMAYTVTALTRTLHNVTERNWNGLYLLPLKTGSKTFVQSRIDPIIESNRNLEAKFGSVDNVLHKQTDKKANLYIRGTNILRELQEIPVDFEIWDEYDRMVIENMPDARHRMDGSTIRQLMVLSTPTVDGYGVYSEEGWDNSDQNRWEVPCPGCGRFQVLNWDEPALDYSNLKIGDDKFDCALECAFCKREIHDHERPAMNGEGRWSAFKPDGRVRGYHISQFNSPTQPLYEIMSDYFAGQRDVRRIRAFWNQNMGRAYTAAGDKITPELLDKLRKPGYIMGGIPSSALSVGIDVGTLIHCFVWHESRQGHKMLYAVKTFRTWPELDTYLSGLTSWKGVIDAHPEKSKAYDLAMKYHGRLWIGFSDDRPQAHEMANFGVLKHGEAGHVTIDKTMALDTLVQAMLKGQVVFPNDARELGEHMPTKQYNGLYHQMTQMVRIEEEDTKGKIVGRWKKNRNADHWHHAAMFATVATQIPVRNYASAQIVGALQGSLM
jgi:hypothetical protein